ncbi:MAG: hypothetical protein KC501_22935, partial [Myxococcales bacterium]|nr:hypothetical protein [Myxococcales bacterium]
PPPAEVAPPPGEPAPAIATEPEASEEVEPMPAAVPPPSLPPPRQTLGADAPPPPHRNGRGMLVAAAVLGTIGGVIKIGTTVAVAKANRTPDGLPLATLMGGAYFYDPFIGVALGLAGGGMARRGKVDAHRELFEGEPATRKRRMGLGWALFGGGVAMWSLTRLAGAGACREQACTTRIWETGYYLSLLGTVPGVIMGGYATGFNRYHKRYGHLADVTVAPIAHRNAWGLSLSGRF